MPATFYIASLPFQDTPPNGGSGCVLCDLCHHSAWCLNRRSRDADRALTRHGVIGLEGTVAPPTWPSLSGRQVLLFHASACDELTPPLHRAPPGQHAGHPLAEGTHPRAFVPGIRRSPGFDAIVPPIDASAVVHARSSSRRTPDPLTAGLFPQRSPPRLLTDAACGGLGSPPARRTRRANLHHWYSTLHAGDLLHRHHSTSGHTWGSKTPYKALTSGDR